MAIANERWFGTLPAILATPANRVALFAGRFLPFVANGLFVSLYAFGSGVVFLGVRLAPRVPRRRRPGAARHRLLVHRHRRAAGRHLAPAARRPLRREPDHDGHPPLLRREHPAAELPGWMQFVGNLLPFTHGLQAVRQAADGAGLGRWAG